MTRITNLGVLNLSSRTLSLTERRVLGLGLKFVPVPSLPPSSLPSPIITAVQQLHRSLAISSFYGDPLSSSGSSASFTRFRVPNPNWYPPVTEELQQILSSSLRDTLLMLRNPPFSWRRNLSAPLRAALFSLRDDHSIVIKPADKNVGITVMDREFYINLCMEHLLDPLHYEVVTDSPVASVREQLQVIYDRWRFSKAIHGSVWKFFFQQPARGWQIPLFYCLLKVHKRVPVGRPIAASHSWVTSNVSRWLDAELRPLVEKQPTYLRDSQSLLLQLESSSYPPSLLLATYDVQALYPPSLFPWGWLRLRVFC